jgi:hypothetical protein
MIANIAYDGCQRDRIRETLIWLSRLDVKDMTGDGVEPKVPVAEAIAANKMAQGRT